MVEFSIGTGWSIYAAPLDADRILKIDTRRTGKDTMGQILKGDDDDGTDQLGLKVTADVLADFLANSKLEPPFVLGILGKWGSGKSFFINLMKKRFIEIQREKVDGDDSPYVGHLYYIKFDAWTFGKEDLWASLMFRIFQSLNEQLEIEAKLMETRDLREGGLSVIELFDKLSKAEKEYFNLLDIDDVDAFVEDVRHIRTKDQVSKPFNNIFAKQMKKDRDDLKKAEELLNESCNQTVWKSLNRKQTSNVFLQVPLTKINTAATQEEKEKMEKMNFDDIYNSWDRLKVVFRSAPPYVWFLIIVSIAVPLVVELFLSKKYSEEVQDFINATGSISAVATTVVQFLISIRKASNIVRGGCEEFLNEIKTVQNLCQQETDSDVEAVLTNDSVANIQKEQKKIAGIKSRLKVLEGDSI